MEDILRALGFVSSIFASFFSFSYEHIIIKAVLVLQELMIYLEGENGGEGEEREGYLRITFSLFESFSEGGEGKGREWGIIINPLKFSNILQH